MAIRHVLLLQLQKDAPVELLLGTVMLPQLGFDRPVGDGPTGKQELICTRSRPGKSSQEVVSPPLSLMIVSSLRMMTGSPCRQN